MQRKIKAKWQSEDQVISFLPFLLQKQKGYICIFIHLCVWNSLVYSSILLAAWSSSWHIAGGLKLDDPFEPRPFYDCEDNMLG